MFTMIFAVVVDLDHYLTHFGCLDYLFSDAFEKKIDGLKQDFVQLWNSY